MKYKVLKSLRFMEAPNVGDTIELDDIAARVPLIEGTIEPMQTKPGVEIKAEGTLDVETPVEITEREVDQELVCDKCGKEAKSNAGLAAHKRIKHQ